MSLSVFTHAAPQQVKSHIPQPIPLPALLVLVVLLDPLGPPFPVLPAPPAPSTLPPQPTRAIVARPIAVKYLMRLTVSGLVRDADAEMEPVLPALPWGTRLPW